MPAYYYVVAFIPLMLYVVLTLVVHGRRGPGVLIAQLGGLLALGFLIVIASKVLH